MNRVFKPAGTLVAITGLCMCLVLVGQLPAQVEAEPRTSNPTHQYASQLIEGDVITTSESQKLLEEVTLDQDTGRLLISTAEGPVRFEDLKTLDHVRQLKLPSSPEAKMVDLMGAYGGGYGAEYGSGAMDDSMGGYGGAPPDPRQQALNKINDLRRKLKAASEEDRPKIAEQLRGALSEYFLVDMQLRVKELDEIKARVDKMEAKLQQRLDTREEAVDLQLKLFLRDAEGLGFFRSADNSVGPYYHAYEGAEYSEGIPELEPPAKSFQPESGSSSGPLRNPVPRQKR